MSKMDFPDLPDWDDEHFRNSEPGADNAGTDNFNGTAACKALYKQWQQVVYLLNGAISAADSQKDAEQEEEERLQKSMVEMIIGMIMGDALQIGVRIRASDLAGGGYVLLMENAAIIRKTALDICSQLLLLRGDAGINQEYITVIRAEIDIFRNLFCHWVALFAKDDYQDEWGLFI